MYSEEHEDFTVRTCVCVCVCVCVCGCVWVWVGGCVCVWVGGWVGVICAQFSGCHCNDILTPSCLFYSMTCCCFHIVCGVMWGSGMCGSVV